LRTETGFRKFAKTGSPCNAFILPNTVMAKKQEPASPHRIGILRGMETTFPDALIPYINQTYGPENVVAEFVQLDAVTMDDVPAYDVVLDRISHEVPFYRSWLKSIALKGAYICNNPFWWSADDKFIDNIIAEAAGVAVPKSVILPHKDHPPNTKATSFRNLKYPMDWERVFAYIGFPAFLKPHDGGGWRGVTKVSTPQELFEAYDDSGTDCMMLQEAIEFTEYFRCYGVGQEVVHLMRYNPLAPHHLRYKDVPSEPIAPAMRERLERDVLALCRALGYDLNTVEFAVRDGVPYAIDFMNPAPDGDYHSVGHENFEWIVKNMGAFLVKKAKQPRRRKQFTANGYLEPAAK
jgi:glutathione synthase/RimK-type ligase-like ATP-grasp enzyme